MHPYTCTYTCTLQYTASVSPFFSCLFFHYFPYASVLYTYFPCILCTVHSWTLRVLFVRVNFLSFQYTSYLASVVYMYMYFHVHLHLQVHIIPGALEFLVIHCTMYIYMYMYYTVSTTCTCTWHTHKINTVHKKSRGCGEGREGRRDIIHLGKVTHIINGWITDTATLVEVVIGLGC